MALPIRAVIDEHFIELVGGHQILPSRLASQLTPLYTSVHRTANTALHLEIVYDVSYPLFQDSL
jgi:hypothetical protein